MSSDTSTPPGTAGGDGDRPLVVVGIDGSAGSRAALREALLEAGRRGARLLVLSAYPVVLPWTGGVPVDVPDLTAVAEDTRSRAQGFLDEVRAEMLVEDDPGLGPVPVELDVAGGPAADVLVHRSAGAELLVVGNRGRGAFRSAVVGSVALHCVTHAPCPVVVVHDPAPAHRPRRGPVVVGADGSATSTAAFREAVAAARRLDTGIEVVAAYSLATYWTDMYSMVGPSMEQVRAGVQERAQAVVSTVTAEEQAAGRTVPPVRIRLIDAPAAEALLQAAEAAAGLVVGSRGAGTVRGLVLGSVALQCAIHAHCPVTVVHPQDRPAPARAVPAPAGAPA